jgi:anthranilate phosphoribosyltransferase
MQQQELLQKLLEGQHLSPREMQSCMNAIMNGDFTQAGIAAVLALLQKKGVTPDEAVGAYDSIIARSTPVSLDDHAVDTCGTGGDHAGTFNVSTIAAIIACGAGVRIAKHGNRSITSRCGSADVLEALGYAVDLPPEATEELFRSTGFAFLFAPMYHPSMKAVAAIRRELGIRTVFNTLGPLLNPARIKRQLIGVFDPEVMELYTRVLRHAGCVHALIVHGQTETGSSIDEPSICGSTSIVELQEGRICHHTVYPEDLGLKRCRIADLEGGDSSANARIIREILDGSAALPKIEASVYAAAMTCYVSGLFSCIDEGLGAAKESLESGAAASKLDEILLVNRSVAEKYRPSAN